ncbi:MAG: hypothetical protein ABSD47_01095 [Candidatus Methylomirabilota bacterium]|jgi:hypothetical protein
MRVRLVADDEAPAPLAIGESTFWVRRIPESRRREVWARRRREIRRAPGGVDSEALAVIGEHVEDDLLDYALVRWEKLEGDPPCSAENKVLLPQSVREILLTYARGPVGSEEETGKNSAAPSAT